MLEQESKGSSAALVARPDKRAPRQRDVQPGRRRLLDRLFEPVDISSLVFFRIAFGAILAWEVVRYFKNGWIPMYWIEPSFYFDYLGFGWLSPLPGDGMYLMFVVLGIATVCFAAGFGYRLAAALVFLGFSYIFLLDKTTYLNHFYLIILLSLLMVFVPAHRALSLDAHLNPALRSNTAPAWALYMLRAQVGLVYFFGGIAKLNGDWLRGEPIGMWLAGRTDFPLIGPLLDDKPVDLIFAYGGLTLDLLAFPLLLWRRTRAYAFAAVVGFHLMNTQLFNIGIFPWFMIAASTLFFDPDWPRRLARKVRSSLREQTAEGVPADASSANGPPAPSRFAGLADRTRSGRRLLVAALAVWFAVQILVPLRHHLYPGNVAWTEEGHKFSWRMKLRDKETVQARFFVTNPSVRQTWEIDPFAYVTPLQAREMTTDPDMVIVFAHRVADRVRKTGVQSPQVRARILVSLNGREPRLMIDPRVDLAAQKRPLIGSSDWILPLNEPLRR